MTCFTCKVCGKSTEGSGLENKWHCSKCNNKCLIQELLECHFEGLGQDRFHLRKKILLKIIKSCCGMKVGIALSIIKSVSYRNC